MEFKEFEVVEVVMFVRWASLIHRFYISEEALRLAVFLAVDFTAIWSRIAPLQSALVRSLLA